MDVNPTEVGFNFVARYYETLIEGPIVINQFYSTHSSMTRIDLDSAVTASSVPHIHTLVMSLNFIAIEIMTVNSLASWQGGVIVMLSGLVKIKDISRRREFVQTFFLAPQRMSYFVLNDIFHFIDDGVIFPNLVPLSAEYIQTQPQASIPVAEPPASDYGLVEEARDYFNSLHIEDDRADKYSLPEQEQLRQDLETGIVVKETPAEEASPSIPSVAHTICESPLAAFLEELLEDEPAKKTYASVLQIPKGQSVSSVRPSCRSFPTPSEFSHLAQPSVQQSNFASNPDSVVEAADEGHGLEEGRGRGGSSYQTDAPRGHFGARSLGRGSIQDTADNKGDDYPPLGRR